MHCDVHYYLAKFEIKIQLVYGVTKKEKLYYGVKWTKWHSLEGKLNQVIVYGVIQTLAIVKGSNLNFF